MPQEPKKRHSRQRQGKRRASIRLALKKVVICPNCKEPTLSHTACKKCGFYKGIEVVRKRVRRKKKEEKA
ncbi:MAG: 50S ribosomal protein L32 [Candidatus Levybacteria bacterium RBG_16_35_11]|nr:MAG: 50S ribosomal protein L32 [Candidatus Levybacteria bacterium RBG_16_35_11]